jgi:hypothetical protein
MMAKRQMMRQAVVLGVLLLTCGGVEAEADAASFFEQQPLIVEQVRAWLSASCSLVLTWRAHAPLYS